MQVFFYRDKPILNRGIPSWDLSLVLISLTKAPFEPLKDASLKILTFKTVFLMALASGKRRGEVHAWTFSSLRHKPHWKEVTISPSPAFLAKNQLASDCPDSLKPVVIPALKPFLSSDLTEDITLSPVRALRYYLDRTSVSCLYPFRLLPLEEPQHVFYLVFKRYVLAVHRPNRLQLGPLVSAQHVIDFQYVLVYFIWLTYFTLPSIPVSCMDICLLLLQMAS